MYDVSNLPDLIKRFFSSTLWFSIFAVSVAYLFFRTDSDHRRAIFAVVIVFLAVINESVIRLFTAIGENSHFYRHLWAIPSATIIGIAMVDFVRILPRRFLKFFAISAFVIFIWFANQEYIRCRDQIISINAKIVPESVVELSDRFQEIRNENEKDPLYVVCPIAYERSYGNMCTELGLYSGILNISNSSILNDAEHHGETELTGEAPDVPYIMKVCCEKGFDYIIVERNDSVERSFSVYGYAPQKTTADYLIYECSGYPGIKKYENGLGLITRLVYYDSEGKTISEKQYEYNSKGKVTREINRNGSGALCSISEGYSTVEYHYDHNSNCINEIYSNEYGIKANTIYGYSEVMREFYANGQLKTIRYLDKNGELIEHNGRAVTSFEYEGNRRLICETYYNGLNELQNRTDMQYAKRRIEYNDSSNITGEKYYDSSGKLTTIRTGYAYYTREYDEENTIVSESYYDEKGKLIETISEEQPQNNEVLTYFHCSDGAALTDEVGGIVFTTTKMGNQFNAVQIQLWNARNGQFISNLITGYEGKISGKYVHASESGLFYLRVKANSNLEDEYIKSLIYLNEGDTIECSLSIDKLTAGKVMISGFEAQVVRETNEIKLLDNC